MKENKPLPSWRLLALVVIGQFLWPSVSVWSAVAQSQPETQQQETHWPTHYVIVVRNTSLDAYVKDHNYWITLISRDKFDTAIDSIPNALAAASGQIPLWRKPEPGDLISVVFAAAENNPRRFEDHGCEPHHYLDPAVPDQSSNLEAGRYFELRAHIVVQEHDSPSDIADSSSELHKDFLEGLVVKDCDLIATSYSEALTLAEGLPFVETGDANRQEKYEQFFLLVFDFASPAYGSTEFNATFDVSHEDLAPGTPAYLIASIGSLKFSNGDWSVDRLNYLDYPAQEPGTRGWAGQRDESKFYPRIRFYRAIAHEPNSDPFYGLTNAQRDTEELNLEVAQLEDVIDERDKELAQRGKRISQLEEELDTTRTTAFVAWIVAATVALLMVLITWQWWASKGRVRRAEEEYQKELQQMREDQSILTKAQERHFEESRRALAEEFKEKEAALDAEKEKLKSQLRNAICIPDAHNMNEASEFA